MAAPCGFEKSAAVPAPSAEPAAPSLEVGPPPPASVVTTPAGEIARTRFEAP